MMRTAVTVDETLLREAKRLAERTRRPLGHVVDEALAMLLARERGRSAPATVDLPVSGGSGLQPGVDLEDKDALAEILNGPWVRPVPRSAVDAPAGDLIGGAGGENPQGVPGS